MDSQVKDLEEWRLCLKINLPFFKKLSGSDVPLERRNCPFCGADISDDYLKYRSRFFSEAVKCPGCGSMAGIGCDECDEELVLNISRRKQRCPNENCQHFLQVDKNVVRNQVGDAVILDE